MAHTVTVKVRDASFTTATRQRTLAAPTDETEVIFRAALELARPRFGGIKVRLLGVSASHLDAGQQLALFHASEDRHRRATQAADEIRRRFGSKAIQRARLLDSGIREPFERDPLRHPGARARGPARSTGPGLRVLSRAPDDT